MKPDSEVKIFLMIKLGMIWYDLSFGSAQKRGTSQDRSLVGPHGGSSPYPYPYSHTFTQFCTHLG